MELFHEEECEWGVCREPEDACHFCQHPATVLFNEHYTFCPNCSAIYTVMSVEQGCAHFQDGESGVLAERVPWYSDDREGKVYATETGEDDSMLCSICHKHVILDGW